MSVKILNKAHIDALLTYAAYSRLGTPYYRHSGETILFSDLNRIGQILVEQNVKSYNTCYNEQEKPYYQFSRFPRRLTPLMIIKGCDCYIYQSCESPDWKESEAKSIIHAIRERAIIELPGYEEMPWEIE